MSPPKPHFELSRVFDDGSSEGPEIVPLAALPWGLRTNRLGFLGAGVTAAFVLAQMGCGPENDNQQKREARERRQREARERQQREARRRRKDAQDNDQGPPQGGVVGGGSYCSCNQVCTCIPVSDRSLKTAIRPLVGPSNSC